MRLRKCYLHLSSHNELLPEILALRHIIAVPPFVQIPLKIVRKHLHICHSSWKRDVAIGKQRHFGHLSRHVHLEVIKILLTTLQILGNLLRLHIVYGRFGKGIC